MWNTTQVRGIPRFRVQHPGGANVSLQAVAKKYNFHNSLDLEYQLDTKTLQQEVKSYGLNDI